MKKIIALFLAVIMMFSMTSVSYAANTTVGTETSATTTIDNYMDYLETKLEDSNIFIKLIARLVIIGVMLGIIKVEDFEAWFDNTTPDTDTDTEVDDDKPTLDDNTSTDWEDGAEVKLHSSQTLPYTKNGVTITDIKMTKEHYNNDYYGSYYLYKYNVTIEGFVESDSAPEGENPFVGVHFSFDNHSGAFGTEFEAEEDGTFTKTYSGYSQNDCNTFVIYSVFGD